jgi:hypothetical protein
MSLHIYTAPGQPLTQFNAGLGIDEKPHWVRYNPRRQFQCHTCGFRRYAKNLRIKCFYDHDHIFCADGHEREFGDGRRRLVPARIPKLRSEEK